MPEHGPYETQAQARAAARAAFPPAEAGAVLTASQKRQLLGRALQAAGVPMGRYGDLIVEWLGTLEDAMCAEVARWVMDAWDGGSPHAYCRHCGMDIEPCTHPRRGNPVCKGWRHEGYEDKPVGAHYCEGRSINPSAEPALASEKEGNDDRTA